MNYDYEYLRKNGVVTLEDLVGQTLYFTFPSQGIKAMEVRKVQFTKKTREWFFDVDSSHRVSEIGKSVFFSEDEAVKYQHSIMEQYTKEQQEKIVLREQRQREEDLKQLERLIRKYADNITIKVDHYISENLDSGVIGHRSEYADYEDIEEIKRDNKGNIELAICVCERRLIMDKDLLLWLYEQKDDIDAHLYGTGSYSRAEGTYRQELFAQMNLLDNIIRHVKKGQ